MLPLAGAWKPLAAPSRGRDHSGLWSRPSSEFRWTAIRRASFSLQSSYQYCADIGLNPEYSCADSAMGVSIGQMLSATSTMRGVCPSVRAFVWLSKKVCAVLYALQKCRGHRSPPQFLSMPQVVYPAQTTAYPERSVRSTASGLFLRQIKEGRGRKWCFAMKKLMLMAAVLGLTSTVWAGTTREATIERLDHAGRVLHEIMAAPDKGIPEEVLEHARCIAVVPHLLKGGFVFGGENGRGVATCRTSHGWSAPAFFAISGGSWGLQIGIEGVDLVMIVQNDRGMQRLLSSKFELGADASAAAGPVGRHASANTDWKLNEEILTYSRAKGAFAGITLDGASIRRDDDSTQAIYGRNVSTRAILGGKIAAPAAAASFLNAVRGAKAQAVAAN